MEYFWKKSIDVIKEKVTKQNFDTWISPVRINAMETSSVELSVPNRFFRDWLNDHFLNIITDSVSSVAGTPMTVRFSVDKNPVQAKPAATKPTAPDHANSLEEAESPAKMHPSLNPNYNFERFVVGPSNQFAHAAAVAVAEAPAETLKARRASTIFFMFFSLITSWPRRIQCCRFSHLRWQWRR